MEVTRSKLGWIPKTRLVDSNAESSVHARSAANVERPRTGSNKKRERRLVGGSDGATTSDTTESAGTARHFEARRGEAEEEGTRDRRHG